MTSRMHVRDGDGSSSDWAFHSLDGEGARWFCRVFARDRAIHYSIPTEDQGKEDLGMGETCESAWLGMDYLTVQLAQPRIACSGDTISAGTFEDFKSCRKRRAPCICTPNGAEVWYRRDSSRCTLSTCLRQLSRWACR